MRSQALPKDLQALEALVPLEPCHQLKQRPSSHRPLQKGLRSLLAHHQKPRYSKPYASLCAVLIFCFYFRLLLCVSVPSKYGNEKRPCNICFTVSLVLLSACFCC